MTYGVRGATVRFGDRLALDDVTVEVPSGSVVAVVGGDGAGKSTLLRALVGEVVLLYFLGPDLATWGFAIGMALEAVYYATSEDVTIVQFRPAAASE